MATSKPESPVRERLLEAANELFYQEGVHTVGIDRVLERAGVAKASLYGTFGSKDELVRAYLERRSMMRRERISQRIAQHDVPRAQISIECARAHVGIAAAITAGDDAAAASRMAEHLRHVEACVLANMLDEGSDGPAAH